ncbi:meiosis-specific kinetochore protein [Phodopus roborovskii]|uniref:meiosis-specific kinetochore protein n=1 Tax=Phodopus roborovskii TaxID=109678 RepID=UPI0021E3B7F5|nr:meiosis-specific kinetochore protein [Phodopus roborovskii]
MDKMGRVGHSDMGGVAMWPRRVYTHKKRAGERLNLTPKPDLALPGKTEAPPGLKGKGKEQGLRKITENEELSRPRGSSSQLPSQLSVTGGESLRENSPGKETSDKKITPLRSVTNDFKIDSCSSSSELVSGLTVEPDISSCPLSCSDIDSYSKSPEESRSSSFSSPEIFRGSDYLDWEHPKLEEYKTCKNSTLLDTSKAVAVEKVPQLANLSAILSSSSENYEKCHRKIGMTLEAPHISPEPKSTSNLTSVVENEMSEVIFAEQTGPPTTKKTRKKPEKESEDRGPQVQTKLSSGHLDSKTPFPYHSSALESLAVRDALLPQSPEPMSKKSSTPPDKRSKALFTSTPSSDTADFVIDLSPVQNVSFEELFPNVSNYVNSSEVVPVSSWQESSSNEFPSYASEICCIIRASPGTRQMRSKDIAVKKMYSPPKDVPPDIIMKTNGRT